MIMQVVHIRLNHIYWGDNIWLDNNIKFSASKSKLNSKSYVIEKQIKTNKKILLPMTFSFFFFGFFFWWGWGDLGGWGLGTGLCPCELELGPWMHLLFKGRKFCHLICALGCAFFGVMRAIFSSFCHFYWVMRAFVV